MSRIEQNKLMGGACDSAIIDTTVIQKSVQKNLD